MFLCSFQGFFKFFNLCHFFVADWVTSWLTVAGSRCWTKWVTFVVVDWLTGWLTDLQGADAGQHTVIFFSFLIDWLIDWLVGWLTLAGSRRWTTYSYIFLSFGLTGWLIDWLTDHCREQTLDSMYTLQSQTHMATIHQLHDVLKANIQLLQQVSRIFLRLVFSFVVCIPAPHPHPKQASKNCVMYCGGVE